MLQEGDTLTGGCHPSPVPAAMGLLPPGTGAILPIRAPAASQGDLVAIAARASFLHERLHASGTAHADAGEVGRRLERWSQAVGRGDPDTFKKRLTWDGLDQETVAARLGPPRLAGGGKLPGWTGTLAAIMRAAPAFGAAVPKSETWPVDPQDPVPFEELLLPAIRVARERLLARCGSGGLGDEDRLPLSVLTAHAYRALERGLLQRLARIGAKAFHHELSRTRPFGASLVLGLLGPEDGESGRAVYEAFVARLLGDGLRGFFSAYPVLARLLATAVDLWVEATAELLQRLARDRAEIGRAFGAPARGPGRVDRLEGSLSDPHRGGRAVIALGFESGLRLIYKPKDMTAEASFNGLLAWCNRHRHGAGLLDLRPLKVLARDGYGWVEHVGHEPCADEAAVARFYERAGMLLCLLYVLRATDCHNENLIAAGEDLVLIDAETLLHHEARPFEDGAAFAAAGAAAGDRFWDSVVRVGLLPRWDFSPDRRLAYDISGLGGADPEQAVRWPMRWRAVNTDAMHQARERVVAPLGRNVPVLPDGSPARPASEHVPQIVAGFAAMYRFLMAHRAGLLAPDGPLQAMRHQPARFVFRATRVYAALLERLVAPEHLRDGAEFGIELDQLSVAFLAARSRPHAWPVLAAERHALARLDIPYFVADADTSDLGLGEEGGAVIADHFARPSFEAALERLRALGEDDLAWQVAIIEGSFHAMAARSAGEVDGGAVAGPATPLRGDALVEAARSIAAELAARAVREPRGGVSWIGLGLVHEAERFQLQPLGDSLYDGRGGVALFLAALHAATGEMRHRDLALRALEPLRRRVREPDPESRRRDARLTGIGGAGGLGSLIYALAASGRLLADRGLLDDATALAGWITPGLIAADERLDVIGGAAGAALGLLTLHAGTGDPAVLATAAACGRHLLARRVSHEGAPAAWRTLGEDRPLTGFSHGAAGIAYALLRLHAATGDDAFRAAAVEAMAYERSVFSAEEGNWPDFRAGVTADGRPGYPAQWCHGAPGIALARLGGLGAAGGPEVVREIELALRTTRSLRLQALDHLCCGNMGRAEALLVGAERTGSADCREAALRLAAEVVGRAGRSGGAYRLFGNLPPSVFSPALFRGTAGIGYGLLRLADGDLPSVLLWE